MLDYPSLAAVAAVVQEGSFERAARKLNVTASAVSQRVKQLEDRLGSVLIVRGQPCRATEAGLMLCRHVEHVGMLEQDLRKTLPRLAQDDPQDSHVTLRVAVNADTLGSWFVEAMAAFTATEPALLDIAVDDQDHTVEWLRSGEVLAAVTSIAKPVQGCNAVPLGRLKYVAVASPQFMERYFSEGVNATTLAQAPCLTFNRKDRLQAQWLKRVCRQPVKPPRHWLPSTQAFIDASVAGIGWGVNPQLLVNTQLENGSLVEVLPGKHFVMPMYWQHTRLPLPMLDRLTSTVVSVARRALRS